MFRTTVNCRVCGTPFERASSRGRKPVYCPVHAPRHSPYAATGRATRPDLAREVKCLRCDGSYLPGHYGTHKLSHAAKTITMTRCEVCGDEIVKDRKDRRVCGKQLCRSRLYYKPRQPVPPPRPCENCGMSFSPEPPYQARFCSAECRLIAGGTLSATLARVCEQCGKPFTRDRRQVKRRFCTVECRSAWRRDHRPFRLKLKRNLYRYDIHREPYDRFSVYERDNWTCQLCAEPVDRTARHPQPGSATIDHIHPLSRGGADATWNVQLAHLRCNLQKGARGAA